MSVHSVSNLAVAVAAILLGTTNAPANAGDWMQAQSPASPQPSLANITSAPPVDLVAKGVVIGGQFVNVGAVEIVHAYRAKAFANGRCLFAFQYNVENQGEAKTPVPFRNVVLWDATVLAQKAGELLNGGEARDYFFDAWLEPGAHTLTLRADADHAVAESDETNNQRVSRVVVMGACIDSFITPGAPASGSRPDALRGPAAVKSLSGKLR